MQQLSGLDATFLYLETSEMPMHVGALHVFQMPPGYRGTYVHDLRRHLARRLPIIPVMRKRLWWMPLNLANPAWVDVEPDLAAHVVEVRLPRSARTGDGLAELEAAVGALHPVLLDRKRPLWKMHVLTGLAPAADGCKRVGVYTQLHHAAVDGQAAVALANALLDVTPEPRDIEVRTSKRQKVFRLGMVEMLRGALGREVAQVSQIIKELPATMGTLTGAARTALGGGARTGVRNLTLAPNTPMNVSVSPQRAFAAVTLPMREVKALGKLHGATINDMVMAVCASALRRYLNHKGLLPRKSLVAAVPISLRAAGDTTSNTQASMSLISLGTHIADPAGRLAHVKAAGATMKSAMGSVRNILPTDFPSMGMPWLIEAATALYGKAKVADKIGQVANVTISNVPGPPVPLYMAGARMLTNYPTSIVVHGMALNITVQSYDQSLDFGLMADAAALPDVKALAQAITLAFHELQALPAPPAVAPEPVAPPRSRARPAAVGKQAAKATPAGSAGTAAHAAPGQSASRPTRKRSTP